MTRTASQKNLGSDEIERLELEARLNASATRVFNIIEEARSKMTTEEREHADSKADAILEDVLKTSEARPRRRA